MAEFDAGVVLVDKPVGPSSFAMVKKIRWLLGIKKVGHAGTLDPFASGLLVVCAGRPATRMIDQLMQGKKEYLATLHLGVETTTQDCEGEIVRQQAVGCLSPERIEQCLKGFVGEQLQSPPAFSAVKHKGKPLYHYARQGIQIHKEPRPITIHALRRDGAEREIDESRPELTIRVACSKGTYIRVLAEDIGRALGCGAYLTGLRRLRSGCFSVKEAMDGQLLQREDARARLLDCALSLEHVSNLLQ